MELDQARYVRREPVHEDLVVEPADMRDLEALVSIGPVLDDLTQDRVRQATVRWLEQPNRQYYLGGLRGEPVGMLRAGTYPPQVFIESFIVAPQQRGRGIGRQVLAAVIDRLIAENWAHILLEVATDNDVALSLYRSCGFVEVATYRYYWVPCTLKLGPSIHRRDGIDWP